ncbi:MAG: hypothetical protein VB878_07105 [Pirellulaceae bacterium]
MFLEPHIAVLELVGVVIGIIVIGIIVMGVAFTCKVGIRWPLVSTVAWLVATVISPADLLSTFVATLLLLTAFYVGTRQFPLARFSLDAKSS